MSLNERSPEGQSQKLTTEERQQIKRDRGLLSGLLSDDGAKVPDGQTKFLCPYHNDRNPSAEIRDLPSGFYFVCYACDLHLDYFALLAHRENIPVGQAFKSAASSVDAAKSYLPTVTSVTKPAVNTLDDLVLQYTRNNPNVTLEEVNRFEDPDNGGYTFATVRVLIPGKGKKVMQASFTAQDGWQLKGPKGPLPLLFRPQISRSTHVMVVEGEKCARRFMELGIEGWAATTSAGGSSAANRSDWSPLSGKTVYIWRDNDQQGKVYQDHVILLLQQLETPPAAIFIINVPALDMEEGFDIVDYLELDREETVPDLIRHAVRWSPSTTFAEHLVDVERGNYQLVPVPGFPIFTSLTQGLLPGKSVLLIGSPGSAKSWAAMQIGWGLNEESVPTSTLFLEDGKIDYQKRCIAQMCGRSEYLNYDWQESHTEESQQIFESVRCRIDSYFNHVTCLEAKMFSPETTLDWLADQARRGYRVVILDPVTAMELNGKQWMSDHNFVLKAQDIVTQAGMSLIATTHQKTGVKKAGIDGAAGGQAWSRFTHTNVWLEHTQESGPIMSRIRLNDGTEDVVEHRRSLYITKARNGIGAWQKIAVTLDPGTIRLVEHGVILGKADLPRVQVDPVESAQF